MDKLSAHFTLAEMTVSASGARRGLVNDPSVTEYANLLLLCNDLLEPARAILGHPITIFSGYRSLAVNKLVGGSVTSAHRHGLAADLVCHGAGTPDHVAKLLYDGLRARGIKFDQIIAEFNQWVHIGLKRGNGQQRGQFLRASKQGGITRYTHVL